VLALAEDLAIEFAREEHNLEHHTALVAAPVVQIA
jgi:hypothetical protein